MNNTSIKNFLGIVIAIVIGAGIALAGSQGSARALGVPIFAVAVGVAFLIQWLVFIIAYKKQTEKFFDLTGSLTYISITTMAVLLNPKIDNRSVLLLVMVVVWATRLGTFLYSRVQKQGSDDRFDDIKVSFSKFLLTWTLQGVWVTFTVAAALAAITSSFKVELDILALVGFAVWIFGLGFEVIADVQKSAFRENPENKGKFIQSGLWAWSRHPNYFGEILVWIGVAITSLPVLRGWQYVALISPVLVTLQLTLISGIPMLEKKADQKWGGQAAYEKYKSQTPTLIPRPPSG